MKKVTLIAIFVIIAVSLVSFGLLGGFRERGHSRSLHCQNIKDERAKQVCQSVEKHQVYTLFGHGIPQIGYTATFVTVFKAWCDASLGAKDLPLLEKMSYDTTLPSQLQIATGMLFLMGNVAYNPRSESVQVYKGSVYDPDSPNYIAKGGCRK